jgi:hypothetical protein
MLMAQYTPPRGVTMGPVPTGPAYGFLAIGLVLACLGIGLLAAKERKSGTYIVGLGTALALAGGIMLLIRLSEDQDAKDGLHNAGQQLISTAVAGAQDCATQGPPSPFPEPDGTTFTPPPCAKSPRDNVTTFALTSLVGYRAVRTADFPSTGEVTVTDSRTKAQVCAFVPADTQTSGQVTDGPCP